MTDTDNQIQARIGESFEVVLYSQSGSTGYGWHLAYLPEGVVLVSISTTPVPPIRPGSQTREVFTFTATRELQGGYLLFELLRLWDPTHPADIRRYSLTISGAPGLQAELEKAAGSGRFVPSQFFRSHLPPIMPYGFPDAGRPGMLQSSNGSPIIPLYGFPVPTAQSSTLENTVHHVIESAENCTVKYGFPWGVTADPDLCILKYGFPVDLQMQGGVRQMYGFPNTEEGCGNAISIEAKDVCVVKYGTPEGGIAVGNLCTVKYGFPTPKAP
ncbi:MAG: protease inhibitor I42 family protein [Candidatus Competibacteraceae bacterium]